MRLASRADLARLKGVSNAAVTIACRGALSAACVGDRIDLDHKAVSDYMAKGRGVDPKPDPVRKPEAKPKPASVRTPPVEPRAPRQQPSGGAGRKRRSSATATVQGSEADAPQLDENGFAPEIEDLVAREIAERYGTSRQYVDWLDAYQKQQRARDLWLKNQKLEGQLIDRELVSNHVFGFIDAVFKRLLIDASKTLAARVQNLTRSGASIEEIEREVRGILSTQLAPMKATAARVLRNA